MHFMKQITKQISFNNSNEDYLLNFDLLSNNDT